MIQKTFKFQRAGAPAAPASKKGGDSLKGMKVLGAYPSKDIITHLTNFYKRLKIEFKMRKEQKMVILKQRTKKGGDSIKTSKTTLKLFQSQQELLDAFYQALKNLNKKLYKLLRKAEVKNK